METFVALFWSSEESGMVYDQPCSLRNSLCLDEVVCVVVRAYFEGETVCV